MKKAFDAKRGGKIIEGKFIRRLNRFVIECEAGGCVVQAHLPNPGRLWELLLPDSVVLLQDNSRHINRTMPYTALAVLREGRPVLLHTQMTNSVAGRLLADGQIRGLERARILRREATFGRSCFDYLLEQDGEEIILEVKSCTLFGNDIAMFPDAVTERGRRHLEHLGGLCAPGRRCGVLFVVHTPAVRWFMPDYHTDFAFAQAFLEMRDKLFYRAVSVSWSQDMTLGEECRELEIPWRLVESEAKDEGSYLMRLHFPEDRMIEVGSLGRIHIKRGHYLYVGSAKKNLSRRVERHLRRKKNFHWHIDYLREHAAACAAVSIRTQEDIEHELAAALDGICDWRIEKFGSSDCGCASHLFGMKDDPVHTRRFIELLQHFRMDRLEIE